MKSAFRGNSTLPLYHINIVVSCISYFLHGHIIFKPNKFTCSSFRLTLADTNQLDCHVILSSSQAIADRCRINIYTEKIEFKFPASFMLYIVKSSQKTFDLPFQMLH